MTAAKPTHFHTTIKVSSDVRDRLKAQAVERRVTLGEHLARLAELGDRQLRLEAMQKAIAATPTEMIDSYHQETEFWDSVSG